MRIFRRDVIELAGAFALGFFVAWCYLQLATTVESYEAGRSAGRIEGIKSAVK